MAAKKPEDKLSADGNKANTADDMTIDQKMDELDGIIEKMENDEITLEESFELYKHGVELVRSCNDAIDRVEKEVLKLNDDGSTDVLPDME